MDFMKIEYINLGIALEHLLNTLYLIKFSRKKSCSYVEILNIPHKFSNNIWKTMLIKYVLCLVNQSCPETLCDPMAYSPPGSSVPEDSPGKNTCLEWVAMPSSN